jgi:ATP-dependent RNA helicase DeaD
MTDADPAPDAAERVPGTAPGAAPADDPEAAPSSFAALGLAPALLETLAGLGYEEPTPVQEAAIPPLLAGRDLLAEAPTGTGKTAAFALPILQRLAVDGLGRAEAGTALALILVPTRELAMQVAEAVHRYGRVLGARVLPVYGGQPIGQQLRGLRRGLDIVVATPGRAVDHLTRGSLRLDAVEVVILDEADEMLDMGFAEELDTILSATPAVRQTALFSATISPTIARVASRHLREPIRVSVRPDRPSDEAPAKVRQLVYVVRRTDKLAALGRILDVEDPAAALVFARTRGEVDDLAEALSGRGHDAAALHGGLSQEQRDRVMGRFRDGALDVLVATDVAARGLDIEHVSHVVNFDVPSSPDAYVHRIGRTGRAGREGMAITLVEPREHRLLLNIESATRTRLERATVPSIADLRERRLELLRASLRERLAGGEEDDDDDTRESSATPDLDRYRAVVEALADEYDAVEIALAAIALLDAREGSDETEAEIAPAFLPQDRPARPVRPARPMGQPGQPGSYGAPPWRGPGPAPTWRGPGQGPPATWAPRPPRPGTPPGASPGAFPGSSQGGRPPGGGPPGGGPGGTPGGARGGGPGGAWVRLFIGGGRRAGVRPADLVGAITAEAGVPGSVIGAIQIADSFSLVDVADEVVEQVVRALRTATIRGRTFLVRLDRDVR